MAEIITFPTRDSFASDTPTAQSDRWTRVDGWEATNCRLIERTDISGGVDAILLCTPTDTHARIGVAVVEIDGYGITRHSGLTEIDLDTAKELRENLNWAIQEVENASN